MLKVAMPLDIEEYDAFGRSVLVHRLAGAAAALSSSSTTTRRPAHDRGREVSGLEPPTSTLRDVADAAR